MNKVRGHEEPDDDAHAQGTFSTCIIILCSLSSALSAGICEYFAPELAKDVINPYASAV
jgi:hypothetical protein